MWSSTLDIPTVTGIWAQGVLHPIVPGTLAFKVVDMNTMPMPPGAGSPPIQFPDPFWVLYAQAPNGSGLKEIEIPLTKNVFLERALP